MGFPKISIVTPSYNQGRFIEQTIQSVLSQGYPNLEYIIVDGGSNDGTLSIIKKYESRLTRWISEQDKGQAHAINKGLELCTGEIFNWLNSDDYLEPGVLFKIAEAFNNNETGLVAGPVKYTGGNRDNEIDFNQNLTAAGLMCWYPGVQFIQPGVWMKKELLEKCGGLDEQFHYSFDWDLLIRYLYCFPEIYYLPDVVVHFRLHEESKTVSSFNKFAEEERRVIEKILADNTFKDLHELCKWKIKRTKWTSLLTREINDAGKPRWQRVADILAKINQQPPGFKQWRMTMGAIKQILFTKHNE